MATWQEMSLGCLQAAKLLLAEGQWRGSINRSYYAAYCAVSHELVRRGVRFPQGWNNPAHDQLPAMIHNGLTLPQDTRRKLIRPTGCAWRVRMRTIGQRPHWTALWLWPVSSMLL